MFSYPVDLLALVSHKDSGSSLTGDYVCASYASITVIALISMVPLVYEAFSHLLLQLLSMSSQDNK